MDLKKSISTHQSIDEVISVDIGGTNLRVARVRRNGALTSKKSIPTPKSGSDGRIVTQEVIRLIREVIPSGKKPFIPISISSAGPLDLSRGIIDHCPNIPFGEVPLVQPLEKEFHRPVFLFKDTHAGVLGEKFFGDGQGIANLVYVTISTGIGGGAIVNNHLLVGRNGNAAEIGRFVVSDEPLFWDPCASGAHIPHTFEVFCKQQGISPYPVYATAKDIFEAVRKQKPAALEFLEKLGRINGRGLSSLIVAYDPERIIFGGSVMIHNHDLLFPAMLRHVDTYISLPDIRVTKLGHNVSLLGAAAGVFFRDQY